MARFVVEIDTDSAAFHAYHAGDCTEQCTTALCDDMLRGELADVLRRLRVKITNELHPKDRGEDDPFPLYDTNGVRVGTARFEEE